MSSSRQFIVYSTDAQLRGVICEAAERCKRDALRLLGTSDNWKTPVVIQAHDSKAVLSEAPIAQLHVTQTGAGLKFQLEFRISSQVSVPDVERELLRAIFLEMMYREQLDTPAGTAYVEPPDWLVEGTLALRPEGDSTILARTLATVAARNVLTLEEFLRQKRALLDSPSQGVYRAYSAALVAMLAESPEGRVRMGRFLSDQVQAPNDSPADLRAHFPEMGGNAEQMEESWRFSVARFARNEPYRLLGCEETEQQLAELLRAKIRTEKEATVYTLEEFPQFLRDPAAAADLNQLSTHLLVLSARANPLYRPIVGEYQEVVASLFRGRKRRIPQRLAELRSMREHLSRQMNEIADYMNWFEATQTRTSSGIFQEYLRAAGQALEPEVRRRDPISVYLDVLETQF